MSRTPLGPPWAHPGPPTYHMKYALSLQEYPQLSGVQYIHFSILFWLGLLKMLLSPRREPHLLQKVNLNKRRYFYMLSYHVFRICILAAGVPLTFSWWVHSTPCYFVNFIFEVSSEMQARASFGLDPPPPPSWTAYVHTKWRNVELDCICVIRLYGHPPEGHLDCTYAVQMNFQKKVQSSSSKNSIE